MSYCIYLRKSRADIEAEAHGEGETLARHEAALLNLANNLELEISIIYKEIVSGETISSRPAMQKLLKEVEQGLWQGVLVTEIERLARGDTIDQGTVAQAFKASNTKIITPSKTYNPANEFDEEYFEFGLFMSRREYKTINRRMQAGKLAATKEGKYVPGKPPFGYERVKLSDQKGYTLAIKSDEVDTVRLIFDLYTNDKLGITSIINKLTALNISPPKSNLWSSSTIRRILTNPVYIGKLTWHYKKTVKQVINGERTNKRVKNTDYLLIDGLHQPIITNEQWEKANEIREQKFIPVPYDRKLKNPLSSLIICKNCGHKLTRNVPTASNGTAILSCKTASCNNVSSNITNIENAIIYALENIFNDYKIELKNTKKPINTSADEKSLLICNKELNKIENQLDRIYSLLEEGVYTTDIFLKRLKLLKAQENQLLDLKNKLETNILDKTNLNNFEAITLPQAQEIANIYKMTNNIKYQNDILKEVIAKIDYYKSSTNKRTNKFEIIIYPKFF